METSNIGTLDALADYTELPFMLGAAKVGLEPKAVTQQRRIYRDKEGQCAGIEPHHPDAAWFTA